MFPAIFCIFLGTLIGDIAHHWYFDWAYAWDTWIILFLNFITLGIAWLKADDDELMSFDKHLKSNIFKKPDHKS